MDSAALIGITAMVSAVLWNEVAKKVCRNTHARGRMTAMLVGVVILYLTSNSIPPKQAIYFVFWIAGWMFVFAPLSDVMGWVRGGLAGGRSSGRGRQRR